VATAPLPPPHAHQWPQPTPDDWLQCRLVAQSHGRTFYFASQLLASPERRAVHAAYAFCRVADDLVDRAAGLGIEAVHTALDDWDRQIEHPRDPIAIAFADVRRRYAIPAAPAHDLVAGVRMDLTPRAYESWDALREYCYGVAGTVGLISAPIMGCRTPEALPNAVDLGIAMQLTNILRDVAEDARMGRVYLPVDELEAFGCDPASLLAGQPTGDFAGLLGFQIGRARGLYASARRGIPALSRAGQITTLASSHLYGKILTRIEEQEYDVFGDRAVIPTPRKLREMPAVAAAFLRLQLATVPRSRL